MRVTTESGAVYEFTKDNSKFRRLRKKNDIDEEAPERAELRQDGKWIPLFQSPDIRIGHPMSLVMSVLDPPQFEGASLTHRMTTPVIGVEE